MIQFDEVINRKNTASKKWDTGNNDLLPMWIADMDFKSPKVIIDDIKKRADHGVFGYTLLSQEFKDSIRIWLKKRHDWEIENDWITYSPGIVPAINMLIKALTEKHDKIIIQAPVYYPFFDAIKNNNRKLVNNELILEDGKYKIDFSDLEKKVLDNDTKLLILCSPHNPVGRVWSKEELKMLGKICIENNVLIISDEIHSDIIYKDYKHTPFASISDEFSRNSITCIAPNKTFNIAGLQTSGIIIENNELRSKFKNIMASNGLTSPNIFGQQALISAYNKCENWVEKLIDYLESNLEFLNNYIDKKIPELEVIQPEGTFLVWIDFNGLKMSNKELEQFMLNEAKLWLDEGYIFGKAGSGFERIVIACPREILKEGLKRIEESIKKLNN